MPNYYEISPANGSVPLADGKGSASFSVRYVGDRRVEARVIVEPMEGAEKGWLKVGEPHQVTMEPGQTRAFNAAVTVPPGTPPGRYGLRLDVVSVDNTDEEYDRGPLVTFQVEKSEPEPPQKAFPWWIVIVAALVVVLLAGGVTWWLTRDTEPKQAEDPVAEDTKNPPDEVVDRAPDKTGRFDVQQTWSGDFDLGRAVPRGAPAGQKDFWFEAKTATDRALVPQNGASMAYIGRGATPQLSDVQKVLSARRVASKLKTNLAKERKVVLQANQVLIEKVNQAQLAKRPISSLQTNTLSPGLIRALPVKNLQPGTWYAMKTSEGNWVAFTSLKEVGPSPARLAVTYRLWRNH